MGPFLVYFPKFFGQKIFLDSTMPKVRTNSWYNPRKDGRKDGRKDRHYFTWPRYCQRCKKDKFRNKNQANVFHAWPILSHFVASKYEKKTIFKSPQKKSDALMTCKNFQRESIISTNSHTATYRKKKILDTKI